jgi:hypothetical protein
MKISKILMAFAQYKYFMTSELEGSISRIKPA